MPPPAAGAEHRRLGLLALRALAHRPGLSALSAVTSCRLPGLRAGRSRAAFGAELVLHRIGFAELADRRRLVDRARDTADDHHPDPFWAGPDLALGAGGDPDQALGVEREALPLDLDLAAAAKRHEDLLLAVFCMVVLRVAVEVRGHVDHLQAEGLHPQLRSRPLESPQVDSLHIVDLLHRVLAHQRLLLDFASNGDPTLA